MISPRVQCALALLYLALAVGSLSGAPLDLFLQRSLIAPASKQELERYAVSELLSELVQSENEALESADLQRRAAEDEPRLERGTGSMLAPRERKAGCKVYFWKSFTSC